MLQLVLYMTNDIVELSDRLKATYPGFKVGYHVVHMADNRVNEGVARAVAGLTASLQPRTIQLKQATQSMAAFYKTLGATRDYHIASLINATLNGRKYKSINPAVDLVYIVELEHGILMGLHDLARAGHGDLRHDRRDRNHRPHLQAEGGSRSP